MCTAIAFRGRDTIYGFNLDVDPAQWNFGIYKTKKYFTVGITVGSTTYFTHGVTADGRFGNVPYMNGKDFAVPKGKKRERIDLMTDRYIRGKYSFADVKRALEEKVLVSPKGLSMHSLLGGEGELIIAEPGCGAVTVSEHFAAITNYPVLAEEQDFSHPFYGYDRRQRALKQLRGAGEDFSPADALKILEEAKTDGQYGTRVSFVYSRAENAVFYCLDGDFTNVQIHRFG